MNCPIGTTIVMKEAEQCHCYNGPPHYHTYEAIWNGEKWLRFSEVWPIMEFCYNNDVSKVHHETLAKLQKEGRPTPKD